MARIFTAMAWVFAFLNLLPLIWMVWGSFMGNNEIQRGKLWPEPYRNDVVLFRPLEKHPGLLAATVNGEVYVYDDSLGHSMPRMFDLDAVSVSYVLQGNSLWAFSPDNGVEILDLQVGRRTIFKDWDFFRQSYEKTDLTAFHIVDGSLPAAHYARMAIRFNMHPLVPSGVDGPTLSALTGIEFRSDSTVVAQLDSVLRAPLKLRRILHEWSLAPSWTNPRVLRLFALRERTPRQDRELFRWCLAERFPGELTRFRMAPWEDIWVNRVPGNGNGTSMVLAGKRVVLGMWWDPFPGIAILDSIGTSQARWITVGDGLPSTAVQKMRVVDSTHVLVLHDLGLSLVDISRGRVIRNFLFGEHGLPYLDGRDMRLANIDSSTILLVYGQDGLMFDFRSGSTTRLDPDAMSGLTSEITSMVIPTPGMVLLGSSEGLLSIGLDDWITGQSLHRQRYPGGVVHSLWAENGRLYQGGLDGNLTISDTSMNETRHWVLPQGGIFLHWRNYQDLWRTIPFGRFLFNSLVISLSVVFFCMVLASLASYALARFEFSGRRMLTVGILATQMVPSTLYLIPVFVVYTVLQRFFLVQFVNSFPGIILVYTIFFLPMAIWLLRGFLANLPRELEEAALMDGCGPWTTFWRITMPAALPGVVATAIFVFLLSWDELMFAWVLCTDISTATIPVGIRMYAGLFGNRSDLLMAAATVASLPVVILFFVMQRHIVNGLTGGSFKD